MSEPMFSSAKLLSNPRSLNTTGKEEVKKRARSILREYVKLHKQQSSQPTRRSLAGFG